MLPVSHAIMAANGYENAAGLRIPAPGVVCQAPVAQVMATGSKGGVEDQASSWSGYLEQIPVISPLMDYQMALLPLLVQQQRLF